jgi:hypothetical protein
VSFYNRLVCRDESIQKFGEELRLGTSKKYFESKILFKSVEDNKIKIFHFINETILFQFALKQTPKLNPTINE